MKRIYPAALFILFWGCIATLTAQEQLASLWPCSRYLPEGHCENLPEAVKSSDFIVISDIQFEGNLSTRQHILQRELVFAPGDTLRRTEISNVLEQSRENLLNTSLFNFVNVSLIFHDLLPAASVRFTFVERWYIWPFPIFEVAERNLNDWIMNPSFERTNYGVYVVKENFRGRMERISILARAGYRQNYSLGYYIPYINNQQKIGLSFNIGLNQRNEIEYMTRDNMQVFYSEKGSFALRHFYVNTRMIYRRGIHDTHHFIAEYNDYRFADSLLVLNPLFSPGSETRAPFLSLGYEFKHDHRDIRAYPLNGHYFDIRLKRKGLGLLPKEKMDMTTAQTSLRKFWTLSPRWFYAAGMNAKVTFGDFKPYYLQQGLGFKGDLVRGYENFVIDGQHFAVVKSNFKYALVPQRVSRIGFIANEKFSLIHYALYVNFFTDFGYVHDTIFFMDNPYSNKLLAGAGVGLDLVTYYDKVFRTEFSITRQGDTGVYLHLIAPI
ncbi:MAG: BamA/TamA family outer membrane protein [Bacteroidota bacterium]